MIPISGEPLIHRTQRQLLERGFSDISVACAPHRNAQYLIPSVQAITPPPRTGDIREHSVVWAYRSLIAADRPTLFLFADTHYTDAFMDKLAETQARDFLVYGRATRKHPYQSITPEHFAILLSPHAAQLYLEHMNAMLPAFLKSVAAGRATPAGLAACVQYGLYKTRIAHGVPNPYSYRVEWSDLTDDFDTPADWELKHKHFPDIFARPCET